MRHRISENKVLANISESAVVNSTGKYLVRNLPIILSLNLTVETGKMHTSLQNNEDSTKHSAKPCI